MALGQRLRVFYFAQILYTIKLIMINYKIKDTQIIMIRTIIKFFSAILRGLRDHEFRSLLFFVIIVLLIGTFSYHRIEGWNWLDSFYFSSISLTTVGYGDLVPKTDAGKIFTIIYIFSGVGIILGFLAAVATKAREK